MRSLIGLECVLLQVCCRATPSYVQLLRQHDADLCAVLAGNRFCISPPPLCGFPPLFLKHGVPLSLSLARSLARSRAGSVSLSLSLSRALKLTLNSTGPEAEDTYLCINSLSLSRSLSLSLALSRSLSRARALSLSHTLTSAGPEAEDVEEPAWRNVLFITSVVYVCMHVYMYV